MYEAKILADSVTDRGHRLTTFQITFPRIVLAEFNTHRVLSRNSASSRAIPVLKRIESILEAPFVPAAFGAAKRGMQAGEDLDEQGECREVWLEAMQDAVKHARRLERAGVHKQWANRLLEPFAWHTVIVTATEWDNYWALRVSEMAQPEIFTVSKQMKKVYDANEPKVVTLDNPLPYHLPLVGEEYGDNIMSLVIAPGVAVRLSVARCARVSYLTHDGVRDPEADEGLYRKLTGDGHMSPTEHAARPMTDVEYALAPAGMCGNFRGWVQHRKELPGEAVFGG
jgi:thymidylate synthase ThyX